MPKLALIAFAAASAFAMPALAQSQSDNSSAGSMSAQNGSMQSGSGQNGSAQSNPHIRRQLMQDLQKQGFKNVRVIPDSFLVNATNPKGQPVVMIINPNSVFAATDVGSGGSGGSGGSSGGSSSGDNNGSGSSQQ